MNTTKLNPTFVNNAEQAGAVLFDGVRARACACYTQEGQAVVCCERTAKKNGWTIVARTWK
jgi:hypothetical protein